MINKSKLRKLARYSSTNNNLSQAKVEKISKLLKREDLKYYVKMLKQIERKNTVTLVASDENLPSTQAVAKKISKLYPNKKIQIQIDPTLIAGIKVINDDLIYELSLKNILEEAITEI